MLRELIAKKIVSQMALSNLYIGIDIESFITDHIFNAEYYQILGVLHANLSLERFLDLRESMIKDIKLFWLLLRVDESENNHLYSEIMASSDTKTLQSTMCSSNSLELGLDDFKLIFRWTMNKRVPLGGYPKWAELSQENKEYAVRMDLHLEILRMLNAIVNRANPIQDVFNSSKYSREDILKLVHEECLDQNMSYQRFSVFPMTISSYEHFLRA